MFALDYCSIGPLQIRSEGGNKYFVEIITPANNTVLGTISNVDGMILSGKEYVYSASFKDKEGGITVDVVGSFLMEKEKWHVIAQFIQYDMSGRTYSRPLLRGAKHLVPAAPIRPTFKNFMDALMSCYVLPEDERARTLNRGARC